MPDAINIVRVRFQSGQTAALASAPLYQYDAGQILMIEGLTLPDYFQVHFSNRPDGGSSYNALGTPAGVPVPDNVLQSGSDVFAFVYLSDEDSGETVYAVKIEVIPRPELPVDTPTPEQTTIIQQAIAALNTAASAAETAASTASSAATAASGSATLAESWAVGGTGAREGEDTDNARFYAAQADGYDYHAGIMAGEAEASASAAAAAKQDAQTAAAGAAVSAAEVAADKDTAGSSANAAALSAAAASGSARDAAAAKQAAEIAKTAAQSAQASAEASETAASGSATLAESWAVGGTGVRPAESTSNAAYYAAEASSFATAASTSASSAASDALKAEGWAVGKQNGEAVGVTSLYYENHAAYYAFEAAVSATNAEDSATAAAASAGISDNLAPTFSAESAYSAGDYVIHAAMLYRFLADHAAGDWDATEVEAVTVGGELNAAEDRIDRLGFVDLAALTWLRGRLDTSGKATSNSYAFYSQSFAPASEDRRKLAVWSDFPNLEGTNSVNVTVWQYTSADPAAGISGSSVICQEGKLTIVELSPSANFVRFSVRPSPVSSNVLPTDWWRYITAAWTSGEAYQLASSLDAELAADIQDANDRIDTLDASTDSRLDAVESNLQGAATTFAGGELIWTYGRYLQNPPTPISSISAAALTDPIAVVPGDVVVNLTPDEDMDPAIPNYVYVGSFTANGDQIDRVKISGDNAKTYVVPAEAASIRLCYGHSVSYELDATQAMTTRYFAVRISRPARAEHSIMDPDKLTYVAFGASTTIGVIRHWRGQRSTRSKYPYPNFVGAAMGLKPVNLAVGSTGLLARGRSGTRLNIMDLLLQQDTQDLLANAALVTIGVAYGNDATAGLPVGSYDDYYPYDETGYHPEGSEGLTSMLEKGATWFGCLNWCLKFLGENYPRAQVVVIFGSIGDNYRWTATLEDNTEPEGPGVPKYKIVYHSPYTAEQGYGLISAQLTTLSQDLHVPVIDLVKEGLPWSYYAAYTTNPDGTYVLYSTSGEEASPSTWRLNRHLSDNGYLMFARYITGRISALFGR